MLAHLPNRFNSLTRGRVRATSTPAENHYNGAKLFVFARFAFARSRVCTSPVSRDASRSFSVVVTNYGYVYERNYARACIRACVYVERSPAFPKRVGGWVAGFCMERWKASLLQPFLRTVLLSRRSCGS